MNTSAAVRRAIPVLAQYGHVDPMILRAWLLRAGLSRKQAHDAARFIPILFGREILGDMGPTLSDTYIRMSDGQSTEVKLDDEEFYREALKAAPATDTETFRSIAMRSSELQAVNNALNAGADVANLVLSPPVIEWEAGLVEEPKPWWKFW